LATYEPHTATQTKALTEIRDYCKSKDADNGNGFLLIGKPGLGKTHLIASVLSYYGRNGFGVKYITAEEMFILLRDAMNDNSGTTELQLLREWSSSELLAIDDLHVLTNGEGYQYRSLWYVLDKRYQNRRATIVATNKPLAEFKETIDERTRRRLQAKAIVIN
jgi:DNA replication protein DnaC